MKVRIYYHHTDCGKVVYYAEYLKFLEQARTEVFEQRGLSLNQLMQQGVLFVVSRQEIDYKSPAFYADTLEVNSRIANVSSVRVEFDHQISNQHHKTICLAKTVIVCVDSDFKPKAIPQKIREKLLQ